MTSTEEIIALSAVELARWVSSRRVSCREVVSLFLERIAQINPTVNAIVAVREEQALAEADRADQLPAGLQGSLHGVPFLVKEDIATVDLPTTFGSAAFLGNETHYDAPAVSRLRREGAILLGKTNMPEFGLRPTTENRTYGQTLNPHNLAFSPGGSSGGSAAAVASGLAPMALGGDGGGSVRIPAAWCGVTGLKPTRGLIPAGPPVNERLLGHASQGPIARASRDLAWMLSVIGGSVLGSGPLTPLGYPRFLHRAPELSQIRGAYTLVPAHGHLTPSVTRAIESAIAELRPCFRDLREDGPDLTGLREAHLRVVEGAMAARAQDALDEAKLAMLEPNTVELVRRGANGSAADYYRAIETIRSRTESISRFWSWHDILLTPTTPCGPPTASAAASPATEYEDRWRSYHDTMPFTYPFNDTGQPAASITVGVDPQTRIPIGLQLVGRCGEDALVLAVAERLELALAKEAPDVVTPSDPTSLPGSTGPVSVGAPT